MAITDEVLELLKSQNEDYRELSQRLHEVSERLTRVESVLNERAPVIDEYRSEMRELRATVNGLFQQESKPVAPPEVSFFESKMGLAAVGALLMIALAALYLIAGGDPARIPLNPGG